MTYYSLLKYKHIFIKNQQTLHKNNNLFIYQLDTPAYRLSSVKISLLNLIITLFESLKTKPNIRWKGQICSHFLVYLTFSADDFP